mmetsp:Transcript_13746/g.29355  ORF Transcript_13746/g.29355 Transcript_13746/m.29355 type:complete len:259 (-) Transcript_13746:300-1076(-)
MCVSGRCVAFLTCAALLLLNNCHVVAGATLADLPAFEDCLASPDTCGELKATDDENVKDLTGTIPTQIGELTKVTALRLYGNSLDGTIPTEIGLLTDLEELELDYNKLVGTIPTAVGKLTKLTFLYLSGNNLTGTIPTEIGKLTKLERLFLEQNKLSGSVPFEIFTKLTFLTSTSSVRLYENAGLCGEFPSNFNKTTTGFRVLSATDQVDEYDFGDWKRDTRVGFACPDSSGNRSSMDVTALAMMALVAFITAHVVVY